MRADTDLAQVRQDLAAVRRDRRAEERAYWLRAIGYVTRPVVYFGPLFFVVWRLWRYAVGQSLASLSITDFLLIGGCVVGFFGAAIPLMLFFFNVDGDDIKWEAWGRFGLWLAVVAVVALWLTQG